MSMDYDGDIPDSVIVRTLGSGVRKAATQERKNLREDFIVTELVFLDKSTVAYITASGYQGTGEITHKERMGDMGIGVTGHTKVRIPFELLKASKNEL